MVGHQSLTGWCPQPGGLQSSNGSYSDDRSWAVSELARFEELPVDRCRSPCILVWAGAAHFKPFVGLRPLPQSGVGGSIIVAPAEDKLLTILKLATPARRSWWVIA
jgi:hypothetical protein